MSTLMQAIAGRPGWVLLKNGNARYAKKNELDWAALIAPAELALGGYGYEGEIFAQMGRGRRMLSWFDSDAAEAVAYAEREVGE